MSGNVTVTEEDHYTVAGMIRHLARRQPEREMLVLGRERRTWSEEFRAAVPRGAGGTP